MEIVYGNKRYEIDPKQRVFIMENEGKKSAMLYMPGLPCPVIINVFVPNPIVSRPHPVWGWNGDVYKPTFTPSILTRLPWGQMSQEIVNHVFVREGKIQYLLDCTHEYAGKTMELPMLKDWPEDMRLWD